MIRQVEGFDAKLVAEALADFRFLGQREVHILEVRSDHRVPPEVPKMEDIGSERNGSSVGAGRVESSTDNRVRQSEHRTIATGRYSRIAHNIGGEPLKIASAPAAGDDRGAH